MLRFAYEQIDIRFVSSCAVCDNQKSCYVNKVNMDITSCENFKRKNPNEIKVNHPHIDYIEFVRQLMLSTCQCRIDKDLYLRAKWFNSGERVDRLNTFTDIDMFEKIVEKILEYIRENKEELIHSEIQLERILKTVFVVDSKKLKIFCINSDLFDIIQNVAVTNGYDVITEEPEKLLQMKNGRFCYTI